MGRYLFLLLFFWEKRERERERVFSLFTFFLILSSFTQWGPYNWKTYKEVYDEVLQAGSALRAHGFEPVRKCIYYIN